LAVLPKKQQQQKNVLKICFSHIILGAVLSHHALSLKEIGAVPGGAFKTF